MNLPLVSILIPAYNAEHYIAKAIDSALAQTYPNIEIIVINDGSTDNTLSEAKKFEHRGVKVLSQQNRGQCAAANLAFKESKGSFIKFFDADDILASTIIELQVNRLINNEDYIASCEWARFYNNDINTAKFIPETVWKDMAPVDWLTEAWREANCMLQCAIWLIPRSILIRSGLWDERLSLINDFEFFTRVILHSKGIKFTKDAKLYYRSGLTNSLSGQRSRKAMESAFLSSILATNHLLSVENSYQTRQVCATIFQNFIYVTYPLNRDLIEKAEKRRDELGGSNLQMGGGKIFKILSTLFNWKIARNIQIFSKKLHK